MAEKGLNMNELDLEPIKLRYACGAANAHDVPTLIVEVERLRALNMDLVAEIERMAKSWVAYRQLEAKEADK